MTDMAFFLQNHLRVARNAPRQNIVRRAGGGAGGNGQHIDTGNARTHSRRGGAQNIDPRVDIGESAQTGFGVNLGARIGRANGIGNIGEQQTRGANFCQTGKKINLGSKRQGDFRQCVSRSEADGL